MDYLLFELAGSPPYPDFDSWREIAPEMQATPLEWLAAVNHAEVGIDRSEHEYLLAAFLTDPRFRLRDWQRERSERSRVYAAWPELAFLNCIDTRGTIADLIEAAEDCVWRRAVERALRNLGYSIGERTALLARICEEWKLTKSERELFLLLDALRETKLSDDADEPYPYFRRAGVSQSRIVSTLWSARLKDLSAKDRTKATNRLYKMQSRTNAKIAAHRNDLRIDRPRPGALALAWSHPRLQRPPREKAVAECVSKIHGILARVPSGWLPSHIVTRTIGRAYRPAEIEVAKQRLGIISTSERMGSDIVETWRLPTVFGKMSDR